MPIGPAWGTCTDTAALAAPTSPLTRPTPAPPRSTSHARPPHNSHTQSPQCCYGNFTAAVAGGIDFVDLAGKTQGKDAPAFGDASHKTTLNGFPFHFTSDANRAAFDADPWTYAPAWGGF